MDVTEQGQATAELEKALAEIQRLTDRLSAENLALRASERELSLIVETIPGLVWCASPDGELTYVNQRILDYTGTTLGALAQAGWLHFLHPDDVQPTKTAWLHAVETGENHDVQYRLRRADGAYQWFHVLGQPVRDSDGAVTRWYGLLIDIHDRKNVEEDLRRTQTRLSRATQIATVGELAASITHEINQPLGWRFAHLCSSLYPLCKGLKDFSRMRIQSGVAENLFLPGGLPQISKNIFERNRGFAFEPGPLYGRLRCEEMP
jgi:PAS domain S-box-containing protein